MVKTTLVRGVRPFSLCMLDKPNVSEKV